MVDTYYPNKKWGDRTIYFKWLKENMLNKAYDIHLAAYKECGCLNLPAHQFYWDLILKYGNVLSFLSCKIVVAAIEFRGPCGCQDW